MSDALSARPGAKQQTWVMLTSNTGANGSNVSGEEVTYTLSTASEQAIAQEPLVMASAATNAEIGRGGRSHADGAHAQAGADTVRALASNGEDVVGALCAGDGDHGVGRQFVSQGKVICQWTATGA